MNSPDWSEGLHLRPMTDADINAVHKLETSTNSHPWTPGIIQNCLKLGNQCWLLEQEGILAGYGVIMIAADECTLLNLAISPDYQRQGLGKKLLNFLTMEALKFGAGIMFLEVRTSNTRAIELYQKSDFSEVGIRKNYYPSAHGREDAIVMMRDLTFL